MSSSRKFAIAGAIAGLLVAGLGTRYATHHKSNAAAMPLLVAAALTPAPAAASKANVSREQAVEKLMALPELKRWADNIEQRSGGARHGALIETDPAPRDVKGLPYYQLAFVDNGDDMAQALASFLVSRIDGEILVEDDISGELVSVEQWRSTLKE